MFGIATWVQLNWDGELCSSSTLRCFCCTTHLRRTYLENYKQLFKLIEFLILPDIYYLFTLESFCNSFSEGFFMGFSIQIWKQNFPFSKIQGSRISRLLYKRGKQAIFIVCRERYPALGHLVFFKWEGNKYFSLYAYCFIFKSKLLNPNFVEKKSYFILFFLESYFFDEQSKFLDVRFHWNKKVNSFTNENWNKLKCHRSKVSRRKEKKVCC